MSLLPNFPFQSQDFRKLRYGSCLVQFSHCRAALPIPVPQAYMFRVIHTNLLQGGIEEKVRRTKQERKELFKQLWVLPCQQQLLSPIFSPILGPPRNISKNILKMPGVYADTLIPQPFKGPVNGAGLLAQVCSFQYWRVLCMGQRARSLHHSLDNRSQSASGCSCLFKKISNIHILQRCN